MSENTLPKILIADDDLEIRKILRTHFEAKDCNLFEAADGEQTLESVIIHRPDLVILDVMMPELNGWEICKYIKTHEEYKETLVVMLTGIGQTINELTSPLYQADDFIDKPFSLSELDYKIKKLFKTNNLEL